MVSIHQRTARDVVKEASRIAVLTGAGISAESGIPTFRGPGGIWRTYRAEDLATPEAFARDPKFVWEWYDYRRSVIAEVEPNAGHRALAELEERSAEFTLITQNVDGLHDRAGSRRVLKVHGDIWTLRCTECGREREEKNARLEPDSSALRLRSDGAAGRSVVRGSVAHGSLGAARCARFSSPMCCWWWEPPRWCIRWPDWRRLAKARGAVVVEVNVAETPVSAGADYSLRGPAAEILPELFA